MSLGGGGEGEGGKIPKRGRAGRARSLGIWPGGARSRGGEIAGTRAIICFLGILQVADYQTRTFIFSLLCMISREGGGGGEGWGKLFG